MAKRKGKRKTGMGFFSQLKKYVNKHVRTKY